MDNSRFRKIYEDDGMMVIDKSADVEVGELPYFPAHRLDKDTSGLMIVAKNQKTKDKIQMQFKNRQVKKEYLALVLGDVKPEKGEIVTDIVRDPSRRVPFKAVEVAAGLERGSARVAKTAWEVIGKLSVKNCQLSIVKLSIVTGRTHQIRVHMKHLGHPLIGDRVYGTKESKRLSEQLGLKRQFLHAARLEFNHPASGEKMIFESAPPENLLAIIGDKIRD